MTEWLLIHSISGLSEHIGTEGTALEGNKEDVVWLVTADTNYHHIYCTSPDPSVNVYYITKTQLAQCLGSCHVSLTLPCAPVIQTEPSVCLDYISDGSHGHLISRFGSCIVSKHPFSQGYLSLLLQLWLCCLALSSQAECLPVFLQQPCFRRVLDMHNYSLWECERLPISRSPTKENKLSSQNKKARLGSDPAGSL